MPPKRILEVVRWEVTFGSLHAKTKPAVILRIAINKEDVYAQFR